ncbi:MAG: hypothetical protein M1281_18715 [Chloroflexi bacterium]|nr:hypothetical protein [Chloroflexota bacterium]
MAFLSGLTWKKALPLFLILGAGLIHGIIYVYTVPPWEHYDEPGHFEYVWMAANWSSWPQAGEYDESVRSQISASLVSSGFYSRRTGQEIDQVKPDPNWIGYAQVGDPPLYYFAASLPLRLMRGVSINGQLHAARLVSLGFFLLTLVAAWLCMREITPPGSVLRWIVPATLALVPSFADLMTSVNNDTAAVAGFTFFLWISLRIIIRGFNLRRLMVLMAITAVCILTKSTVYLAAPFAGLVLWIALVKPRHPRVFWGGLALGAVIVILGVFTTGQPLDWVPISGQSAQFRTASAIAPFGRYAIQVPSGPGERILQFLPSNVISKLKGQEVTIGGWVWASAPVNAYPPRIGIYSGKQYSGQEFKVGTKPTFFSQNIPFPDQNGPAWVTIYPDVEATENPVTVYYDGLVLAPGDHSGDPPPSFSDTDLQTGTWGGASFVNLIRNPSAEVNWVTIRSWLDQHTPAQFEANLSTILAQLSDWKGAGWYFIGSAGRMARSFWAVFGWGNITLTGRHPYRLLLILSGLGLGFGLLHLFWRKSQVNRGGLLFVTFAAAIVWGVALPRGSGYLAEYGVIWYPVARYAYPVIFSTILLIDMGWISAFSFLGEKLKINRLLYAGLFLGSFIALDVLSIITQISYYARPI